MPTSPTASVCSTPSGEIVTICVFPDRQETCAVTSDSLPSEAVPVTFSGNERPATANPLTPLIEIAEIVGGDGAGEGLDGVGFDDMPDGADGVGPDVPQAERRARQIEAIRVHFKGPTKAAQIIASAPRTLREGRRDLSAAQPDLRIP